MAYTREYERACKGYFRAIKYMARREKIKAPPRYLIYLTMRAIATSLIAFLWDKLTARHHEAETIEECTETLLLTPGIVTLDLVSEPKPKQDTESHEPDQTPYGLISDALWLILRADKGRNNQVTRDCHSYLALALHSLDGKRYKKDWSRRKPIVSFDEARE